MTNYYITAIDGSATGYVEKPMPLEGYETVSSAGAGGVYLVPASLTRPTPNAFQTLTGPVYDLDAGTIVYSTAYKSLADCKAVKLAELATYRYEQEVGGVVVGGATIKTDRETQAILSAGYVKAREDENYTIASWKVTNGVFTSLDATTIIAIADAVEAHVQACFDNEKLHTQGGDGTGGINALTTQAAVDAYDITGGW